MCTPHVAGSSSAFCIATALGPGLMLPVIALPSQFISSTTCVRLSFVGPQSPLHVPFNGCPNCASAGAAVNSATSRPGTRRIATRIELPPWGPYSILTGIDLLYQVRIARLRAVNSLALMRREEHDALVADEPCSRRTGGRVA